jgi:hypothetical protein
MHVCVWNSEIVWHIVSTVWYVYTRMWYVPSFLPCMMMSVIVLYSTKHRLVNERYVGKNYVVG